MTEATQEQLTPEDMLENLHIMAEEILLLAVAVNRSRLATVNASYSGHIDVLSAEVYEAGATFKSGTPTPECLASLWMSCDLMGDMKDTRFARDYYEESVRKCRAFSQQLDSILEVNRPLVAR